MIFTTMEFRWYACFRQSHIICVFRRVHPEIREKNLKTLTFGFVSCFNGGALPPLGIARVTEESANNWLGVVQFFLTGMTR